MVELIIAEQKNYSSWSLRGWLVMRWSGLAFAERSVNLAQDGYGTGTIRPVKDLSPNGLVPALRDGDLTVWDSLAIAEWAAERVPSLWPADPAARAVARSVVAEMHAGLGPVRRDLSMNILRRCKAYDLPGDTQHAIGRIRAIWADCRAEFGTGGPWLFGQRSIADAFYLPVATRFRTYGIALEGAAQAWSETALADPDFLEWEAACLPDSWDRHGFSVIDGLFPQQEQNP